MKTKELKNLREKSTTELQKQVVDLKSKLVSTAPRIAAGQEKNIKIAKGIRRDIAQILGIIAHKERSDEK
jgi:ribosomal protein L29